MVRKRKLWKTLADANAKNLALEARPETKAAAYRWVQCQAGRFQDGFLKDPHVTVYVDERDGQGWQIYERIDLREIVESWQLT